MREIIFEQIADWLKRYPNDPIRFTHPNRLMNVRMNVEDFNVLDLTPMRIAAIRALTDQDLVYLFELIILSAIKQR